MSLEHLQTLLGERTIEPSIVARSFFIWHIRGENQLRKTTVEKGRGEEVVGKAGTLPRFATLAWE